MEKHASFTVILVIPYRSFSLAAGFFLEALQNSLAEAENAHLLVRDYSPCFTEVDISFIRDILLFKPDIIGFSSFFWNLEQNLKLADLAKSLHPCTFTVFGGPQVGSINEAVDLMEKHHSIDAILCGEADLTFPGLVCSIFSGEEIRDLAGLVRRNVDGIYIEKGPCFVQNLGSLPLIFHEESEYVAKHLNNNDVISLQTLRGCRRNCSYCLYRAGRLRLFPIDRVEKELAFICHHRVRYVRICDSHFGGSKARAMELFNIIRHLNTVTTFYIYPDPSHVDRDYTRAARDANCRTISLGVETMDPKVSVAVNRRFEVKELRQALVALYEGGDTPQLDMMFGLPKQTTQSFRRDLVALRIDRADKVLFSPLMVLPGTELATHTEAKDISIIETPQRYGFSSSIGKDEYVSLMVMTESYRLLSLLHRTDWYIRSSFDCDARYAQCLDRWFYASIDRHRSDILGLGEALRASAAYIRAHATSLAEQVIKLLVESVSQELQELEFLAEVVHIDILEISMKRRKDELSQNIYPSPATQRVFFMDEVVQQQWVIDEDAWLKSHAVPYAIVAKGEGDFPGGKANQVFCVYFCPAGTIFFTDSREFDFLERFSRPKYIFDSQNAYLSVTLEMARKWIRLGVLRMCRFNEPEVGTRL